MEVLRVTQITSPGRVRLRKAVEGLRMDGKRFSAFSRSLATAGTRRGLIRLLVALPLLGGLMAVLLMTSRRAPGVTAPPSSTVATTTILTGRAGTGGSRRTSPSTSTSRRSATSTRSTSTPAPRRPMPPASRSRRPVPAPVRRGQIPNNCATMVDCGSCACGSACPVCRTCNTTTGRCDPHPAFLNQVCAAPGQGLSGRWHLCL